MLARLGSKRPLQGTRGFLKHATLEDVFLKLTGRELKE